jgi:hypothetical protein
MKRLRSIALVISFLALSLLLAGWIFSYSHIAYAEYGTGSVEVGIGLIPGRVYLAVHTDPTSRSAGICRGFFSDSRVVTDIDWTVIKERIPHDFHWESKVSSSEKSYFMAFPIWLLALLLFAFVVVSIWRIRSAAKVSSEHTFPLDTPNPTPPT